MPLIQFYSKKLKRWGHAASEMMVFVATDPAKREDGLVDCVIDGGIEGQVKAGDVRLAQIGFLPPPEHATAAPGYTAHFLKEDGTVESSPVVAWTIHMAADRSAHQIIPVPLKWPDDCGKRVVRARCGVQGPGSEQIVAPYDMNRAPFESLDAWKRYARKVKL